MATQRAEISLGDWVRVLEQLPAVTLSEREHIACCLGFQIEVELNLPNDKSEHEEPTQKQAAFDMQSNKPLSELNKPSTPESSTELDKPSASASPINLPDEILPIHIEQLPNLLKTELALSLPLAAEDQVPLQIGESGILPVPRIPLFPQRTVRGLLSAAVAQPVQGFDLDIPHLIRASVQRQPLCKLPLLPRMSTRNGCQLLLDFSDALIPWWDDMRDLMQQFHAVLGETACPVYEFNHDPHNAVRWTEEGEKAWKNEMVTGKPVVIATDFGQVSTASHELRPSLSVWRDFALYCRRRQIHVIALIPEHGHYSKTLGHHMSIIEWRAKTRASDVKRLINHKQGIQ